MTGAIEKLELMQSDALLLVDVQNDFLPGGALAVPGSDEIVPVLNRYIARFCDRRLPVFITRDWHPPDHCSFQPQGGPWPVHCVAHTLGANFAFALELPAGVGIISKATRQERDAYSGFEGTELEQRLRQAGIQRLFVGGLATDYCVMNTVRDALRRRFETLVLVDAIRAVNVHRNDGRQAEKDMLRMGAHFITMESIDP